MILFNTFLVHQKIDEFEQYGLNGYFSETITASHTDKHKPYSDPLLKFALALWGCKTPKGFKGADYTLSEPIDILRIISSCQVL